MNREVCKHFNPVDLRCEDCELDAATDAYYERRSAHRQEIQGSIVTLWLIMLASVAIYTALNW